MSPTWAIEDFRGKQSGGPEVGLGIAEETMFTLQANGHEHAIYGFSEEQITSGENRTTLQRERMVPLTPRGRASILSTEGSPASRSAWPASGPEPLTNATAGLSFDGCCGNCGHDGSLLRMSPDFYPLVDARRASGREFSSPDTTADEITRLRAFSALDGLSSRRAIRELISEASSPTWMNSGSMSRGRYWTRSTSESRNAAAACSLSAVLEAEVPSKFYLSAKAAEGILRRAERRGKSLPEHLERALQTLSEGSETTSTAAAPS